MAPLQSGILPGCIRFVVLLLLTLKGSYGFTTSRTSTATSRQHVSVFLPTKSITTPQRPCVSGSVDCQTSLLIDPRRLPLHRRPYGCYAVTKEKESTASIQSDETNVNGNVAVISVDTDGNLTVETINGGDVEALTNGESPRYSSSSPKTKTKMTTLSDFNSSHVSEMLDEINRRIMDGSTELIQNITTVVDEQMPQLTESAAQELTEYLGDLAVKLQKAQQDEIQRQLDELEKLFLAPIERVAFSDAPLFELDQNSKALNDTLTEVRAEDRELILAGENSTLRSTSRMRTSELIRNLNVAPLYYSIALLYRWFQKASYPSIYLLSAYKGMANLVKSSGGPRKRWRRKRKKQDDEESAYAEYMKDAEAFQSGWKRTGEIAAKGPLAKKWAILRRSAEIWAYFSSFYLKDRRICNKYNSGRWSEEKFKAERSKLGAEITQNLLRLGPTFIKVRILKEN
jgi:hypothetical protein